MLSLAIATTLIGFALLVVGLITGQVWFAIICIVVCLVGVGLLVVDVIRSGRVAKASTEPAESVLDGAPGPVVERTGPPVVRAGTPEPSAPRADGPTTQRWSPIAASDGRRREPPEVHTSPGPRSATELTRTAEPHDEPAAEGTFTDYVAATTGNFSVPPVQPSEPPQPAPASNFDQWPSYSPPKVEGDPTMHPRESVTRSRRHQAGEGAISAGSSGMPKFDPLDPNWHPPAD